MACWVAAVFQGSDAAETKRLMKALNMRGDRGVIAAALFRAQKASTRAKKYGMSGFHGARGRVTYRDLSYSRKSESLLALCELLQESKWELPWGWGKDRFNSAAPYVLYVNLPTGQVSFHSEARFAGPNYPGDWDGARGASAPRIVEYCQQLLAPPPGTLL